MLGEIGIGMYVKEREWECDDGYRQGLLFASSAFRYLCWELGAESCLIFGIYTNVGKWDAAFLTKIPSEAE